jgi:catechol 2,3-dioxygenase-like lactoylglutathione lyase family enzyme
MNHCEVIMATTTETLLQGRTIVPSLTVGDLDGSARFYEHLGASVEERWEEEGKLIGVMVRAGDIRLALSQDDWRKGRHRMKGVGFRLWINTRQDIDELAAKVKANGLTLSREPYSDFGGRAFDVTDPDGFLVTIANDGTT